MSILSSAAKIVFILFATTVCAAFLMGKLEAKDFMVLATMPFVFYFANKGETAPTENGTTPPYAGK